MNTAGKAREAIRDRSKGKRSKREAVLIPAVFFDSFGQFFWEQAKRPCLDGKMFGMDSFENTARRSSGEFALRVLSPPRFFPMHSATYSSRFEPTPDRVVPQDVHYGYA